MENEIFLEQTKAYNTITADEADQLLEEKANHIIFIGRETCPYCRKFSNKLTNLLENYDLKINFVHSQNPTDTNAIVKFRDKYNVSTVPGLLFSNENELRVRCDSSMSEAEILKFVDFK